MSAFRLTCYRLLLQHPLVKYRTPVSDSRYELRILLIGYGSRMDTLFEEILVNGQLLDTDLYITYLTKNAGRAADALLNKAPELKSYARIYVDGTELDLPETTDVYANIQYISLSEDEAAFTQLVSKAKTSGCNYVVISTGNDLQNSVYARSVSAIFGSGDMIAYILNKKPQEVIESKAELYAFGFQRDKAYLAQLEAIAYNLHYSYMRAANDKASNKQIQDTFNEQYNYVSNLEAALHIREKLECCGIDTSDNRIAAKKFAELMEKDPAVINRLAALEHRRWMMEKISKGFKQALSLTKIYSGPGVTTHDSSQNWHTCLVPCNETSRLTLNDWKNTKSMDPNLDPLDKISLRLHAQCGQIAKRNREAIDNSLSVIGNSVDRLFKDDAHILASKRSMELAISQMWQGKRSALPIYEGNYHDLLDRVSSVGTSNAFYIQQSLTALNDAIAPLKEFISFKDYKDQDRLFIRQIPFALTHKKQPVLMKLMAAKETDCLYSTCRLEPECTAFVSIAASHSDYLILKEHISIISRFLEQSYPSAAHQYHIILSNRLAADHAEKLRSLEPGTIKLHVIDKICHETVISSLKNIAQSVHADYIDVTGGDPLTVVCAADTGVPVIAHSSGSLVNIINAPEIMYPSPNKVITVKEMFDLSGTVLVEESDSSVLSDLSALYKKLYDISKTASNWAGFCQYVSEFYKSQKRIVVLPAPDRKEKLSTKTITLNTEIASSLKEVFDRLSERGYLSQVTESRNIAGQRSFSFRFAAAKTDNSVIDKLHKCVSSYTPTTSYMVRFQGVKTSVIITDLQIRNMTLTNQLNDENLTQEQKAEFKKILDELAAGKLLIDYAVTGSELDKMSFSFQFASDDIVSAIQISGKALEYYIYYSALLDAHFDDVEMGWYFRHTIEEESAENELDIICTKGFSSLFISAKNGYKKEIKRVTNYLNYIIYEVSLLADRFGINAKAVLAMPEIDQFRLNETTHRREFSPEVKTAYRRGVYLLGKECFEDGVLGEVLDRIADGQDDWCDFLK